MLKTRQVRVLILSASVLSCLGPASGSRAGVVDSIGTGRSWWPQAYSVQRDDGAKILRLSTPYYTVQHDLGRGGAISRISLTHGRAANLLVAPIETRVRLARTEAAASSAGPDDERDLDIFSDLNHTTPVLTHRTSGKSEVVTTECRLLNEEQRDSGIVVRTTYAYRWGYIKIHKEFIVPKGQVRIRSLGVLSAVLDPSLTDYGYRPGPSEEMGLDINTWQAGQIRQWGKMRPGTHLDLPFQTRYVPRYIVVANHGVEGLEWFAADDLSQWDYQMTGQPGTGFCEISSSLDPRGVTLSIYPYSLSQRYELPRGGTIALDGTYVFDYYIGVPILEGRAHRPWLDQEITANKGRWISEEDIRESARRGVNIMRVHNDGDSDGDGLFWRDGSYPPYPPEEMKKMDRVIETCHKYGVKIAPYFSNHELHQSTAEFKAHGQEWGRKPDDQGNLRPNYYYGALMCLKSGWFDFFKLSVDRVLRNHGFDGVYYDWNLAMYCNNALHVGKTSNGVPSEKGLGALALSPTGHWDVDELVDLMEWTRERVGPDGLVLIHNTLAPMFTTENFANFVVGMEFTYNTLSVSVPEPRDLPLEWNFGGARSRAVIGYGTLSEQSPKSLLRNYALTTLVTGVSPWPAMDEYVEFFKALEPLGDLEKYRFADWQNQAVRIDARNVLSAVYSRAGEAHILIANMDPSPRTLKLTVDPAVLPYPLASVNLAELRNGSKITVKLDPSRILGSGESISVPANDFVVIHLK